MLKATLSYRHKMRRLNDGSMRGDLRGTLKLMNTKDFDSLETNITQVSQLLVLYVNQEPIVEGIIVTSTTQVPIGEGISSVTTLIAYLLSSTWLVVMKLLELATDNSDPVKDPNRDCVAVEGMVQRSSSFDSNSSSNSLDK